jgi:hypothetical protein
MLLFGHRYEDAKLLQSHGVLLHQFDQREAEARDKQQRERTEPGRPKAPRRQEQPVEEGKPAPDLPSSDLASLVLDHGLAPSASEPNISHLHRST